MLKKKKKKKKKNCFLFHLIINILKKKKFFLLIFIVAIIINFIVTFSIYNSSIAWYNCLLNISSSCISSFNLFTILKF